MKQILKSILLLALCMWLVWGWLAGGPFAQSDDLQETELIPGWLIEIHPLSGSGLQEWYLSPLWLVL